MLICSLEQAAHNRLPLTSDVHVSADVEKYGCGLSESVRNSATAGIRLQQIGW